VSLLPLYLIGRRQVGAVREVQRPLLAVPASLRFQHALLQRLVPPHADDCAGYSRPLVDVARRRRRQGFEPGQRSERELTAQTKGRRLGIYKPHEEGAKEAREKERGEEFWIELCGRPLPAKNTEDGIRAVKGMQVIEPGGVRRYLEGKFGNDLGQVRSAMQRLAESYAPKELAESAFHLYERFRPAIPEGVKGWGAQGNLDLGVIDGLAKKSR